MVRSCTHMTKRVDKIIVKVILIGDNLRVYSERGVSGFEGRASYPEPSLLFRV